MAIAISAGLDLYEVNDGLPGPTPDMCELDGVLYSSYPTAVRADGPDFVLERRREVVSPQGERSVSRDEIHLDRLSVAQLRQDAAAVGLRSAGRDEIPATEEYVGSTVVMFHA